MATHLSQLPSQSCSDVDSSMQTTSRNKTKVRRSPRPCTLRFEVVTTNQSQQLIFVSHGTSHVFDGCNDKDELVRTLFYASPREYKEMNDQNSQPNEQISGVYISHAVCPWSTLIAWDATYDQIKDVISRYFPALLDLGTCMSSETKKDDLYHPVAVLKSPLGSRGEGVYFVSSLEEIFNIIHDNRVRALKEPPEFLENLFQEKGRIPAWVLQREVHPPMLIRQRKFHLRSYIIVLERKHQDFTPKVDVLIYNRHEVRIAFLPFGKDATIEESQNACYRDRRVHITNGACSDKTERILLHHVEELDGIKGKLESFLGNVFGNLLLPDMMKRSNTFTDVKSPVHMYFAIAGVDVMVDIHGLLYLLEVNVNPAAPPQEVISDEFSGHLIGFMSDLIHLQSHLHNSNCRRDDERIFTEFNFISLNSQHT